MGDYQTKQPKIVYSEYRKLAYEYLSKNQSSGGIELSGLITIDYTNLSPDAKAAMMASIAYTIDMINAGEL
jgi:hypothetical protein